MSQLGPFQYTPFIINHPGQPDDDYSVKDPTVKTLDRSKQCLSPFNVNHEISNERISFIQESNSIQLLPFNQKTLETTKAFQNNKKLKTKYAEIFQSKFKLNEKAKKFSYIFDLAQSDNTLQIVLQPTSKLLKYWSLFYLLTMIVQIIIIPLQIEPFFVLFLILKVIDALLNSISTFAINGEIETQLIAIINHYCKSQLVFDLIFLGSLLFSQNYWSIVINLLSNIPRLIQIQKQVQFEYNIFNSFSLLSILIIKAILLIHVITCFWLFNLLIENEDSFLEQYLHSLYYVLSVMTFNSVVIEMSDQQNIIVYSVISLFSLIFFSYFLAKMLTIFRDDELDQQLSEFMTQNNLDSTLKQKIISHLLYQPKYLHDRFISQLSSNLTQEYKISQRSKLINQYFKYFNQNTIQSIIDNSYEIVCQPNQTIIQEGTLDDCSLYFILEGSVCLKSRTNIKLQILKQNNSFGEIGFYTQKPRNFTIQSDGVTRLLKIERTTFLSCLSFNDKQLFYQQRDKILFNLGLPIKCACCQKDDHIITRCPLLTYKPNQSLILQKFIFPHKQNRKEYKRRYSKDMRALNFYQCASQYEVAFLKLFSDQLQISQLSQSQLPYDDFAYRDSNVSARSLTKFSRDRSVVKSTSFMKQQSGYEQQSMPNNTDNLFSNFDQDNEFQIINSNQDKKYDEFESLIRTDQQKRTFATAGFGSQSLAASNKDLTQKSLNIILENEDSDSISEPKSKSVEDENVVDSPQDKFERKNNDPKLTFNYNFETQMNELQKQNQSHPRLSRLGSGSIRQQSSRNSIINTKNHLSYLNLEFLLRILITKYYVLNLFLIHINIQMQQVNVKILPDHQLTVQSPLIVKQSQECHPLNSIESLHSLSPKNQSNKLVKLILLILMIVEANSKDIQLEKYLLKLEQRFLQSPLVSSLSATRTYLSTLTILLDQIILTLCIHLTTTCLTIIMKLPYTSIYQVISQGLTNLDISEKYIFQSIIHSNRFMQYIKYIFIQQIIQNIFTIFK